MINIRGIEYYTAKEMCQILSMAYPSVIFLLRKNRIPKYKNSYIVSKEKALELKEREGQTIKFFQIENEY